MTHQKVNIQIFNEDIDFSLWKRRMLAHLGIIGLKGVIDDFVMTKEVPLTKAEGKQPQDDKDPSDVAQTKVVPDLDKIEKSEQAMNAIISHVGDEVLRKIELCTSAAEMWSTLNELYMETSLPNRIYVQLKFYSFKMNDSKSINENVNEFLKIVAEMNSLDIRVTEEVQAILILNSLPASYSQLKHTLKYGNKTLTVKDVIASAKSLERELNESKDAAGSSTALNTTERGRPQTRNHHKGSQSRDRSRSRSKTRLTCWFCKKEGHLKKDCFARKKKLEGENQGEAGVITEQLVFSEALSVNDQMVKDVWVLDSGCTSHMTSRRDWFNMFQEDGQTTILLGDNHAVTSQGQGSILLNTHGGSIKVLNNVKYVPDLRRNLISTGTLDKLGYQHEGGAGRVRYFKNKATALCGKLVNGLYILDGETIQSESCSASESKAKTVLWHSRLGHMSLNNLKILAGKGLLEKKEIKELDFCEHCVMGKSKKLSFNVGKHNAEDALSYVHADLWGSSNTFPSLSGKQYFLSIIDDKTRKVWLYFLKTKDETFDKFCEWKSLVENQVDKKVKCLRTDNGLEFCNVKFDTYCKTHGIERHRTCTYTPQQNGVAERMNRTIMEKVRCLLNESGLDESFWAEAAATAVYIINRSPSSAIDHNVPEELWLNRKPGYKHLRRFGSIAYVHADQGKLKPRALKGVFLGYPTGTKGYRVWLLDEEKCVISRNVVFAEDKIYKDLKNTTGEAVKDAVKAVTPVMSSVTVSFKDSDKAESSKQGGVVSTQQVTVSDSDSGEDSYEQLEVIQTPGTRGLSNYQLARDRVRRQIVAPVRMNDYTQFAFALMAYEVLSVEEEEPQCYHEALNDANWIKWNGAMGEEMDSLIKNGTWLLVNRPLDRKIIGCRWLFKIKPGIPGVEPQRFKARLVARGFTQREGIDYQEIFAPVVKHISIRILMSVVVNLDLELEQMDVKTAFLHGDLEEELYMEQPEGFEVEKGKDKVCLLKKSLYGLKQAPRQWNKRFDRFMTEEKFSRSEHDQCVYVKMVGDEDFIYLLLYVDDMLIAAKEMSEIDKIKGRLSEEFEMKDMGAASKILGIEVTRDREKGILCLSQSGYLDKVLKRFNMSESKATSTPIGTHFKLAAVQNDSECVDTEKTPYSSAVGSIMYSMISTRPDLAYAIGLVSRFMSKPGAIHWEAVKWLLRYIRGSQDLKLVYTKGKELNVVGYCDSDHAADLDRRRSISGYVFAVGGNTVSWKSCLQSTVALSTTEAEYIALTEAVKEAIWIKGLMEDLGFKQEKAQVWCDSQSALCLAKNNVFHERTKHMAKKRSFLKEVIENGEIDVLKVHTSRNPADMLTKSIPVQKFDSALEFLRLIKQE